MISVSGCCRLNVGSGTSNLDSTTGGVGVDSSGIGSKSFWFSKVGVEGSKVKSEDTSCVARFEQLISCSSFFSSSAIVKVATSNGEGRVSLEDSEVEGFSYEATAGSTGEGLAPKRSRPPIVSLS